jgi:hypothetical protein
MAKKRGRGRPRMPKGASKATVMTVRLQPAERRAIREAAKSDGQKLSDWVRSALIHRATAARIGMEGVGVEPPADDAAVPRDVKTR